MGIITEKVSFYEKKRGVSNLFSKFRRKMRRKLYKIKKINIL